VFNKELLTYVFTYLLT